MKANKVIVSLLAFSMVFMTFGIVAAENAEITPQDDAVIIIEPIIPIPIPIPGVGGDVVWTDKFFYDVGEQIDIFVNLPAGANSIHFINVYNMDDGKYYVFNPYVLHMSVDPGTYGTSWYQDAIFPMYPDRDVWEAEKGIDITELNDGDQVPEGCYRVDWYGASSYFTIGAPDIDVEDFPEDDFKPGGQNGLDAKFASVEKLMDAGNYKGALKKLNNDVIPFIENKVIDENTLALLLNYAYYLVDICEQNL